jgi:hypothetical protein
MSAGIELADGGASEVFCIIVWAPSRLAGCTGGL